MRNGKEVKLGPGYTFLSRSGLEEMKNLRVAYLQGKDCSILSPNLEAESDHEYTGEYFTQNDIDKIDKKYVDEGYFGIDILVIN